MFFLVLTVVSVALIHSSNGELSEEQSKAAFNALYNQTLPNAYSGDMILTSAQRAGLRSRVAVPNWAARWPNGYVPYVIDNSLRNIAGMIQQAAAHIESATGGCVKVRPRQNERNYVRLYYGVGCNSPVGMVGNGVQDISLGDGCHFVGTIIHEIMHSIGFDHEQNRPDRDDYLYIYWQNIQNGLAFAFNKLNGGWVWTPFDYDSVMLYGNNAFSKDPYNTDLNKQYTMVDKFGKRPLLHPYNRKVMTASDAFEIKKFYGCPT